MRAGTHRDLFVWTKRRCFACKNHRWRLGPRESSNSDAKHDVVHAQNDRSCLGLIETCYSSPEIAVLHSKTIVRALKPQRLVILVLKTLFCMHKPTCEGWNQYRLFLLVLSTLYCMHKTTDEGWDPYRFVCLVLKSLFCMHKTKDEGWNPFRLVSLVQITPFSMHKTTGEVWEP